MSLTSWDAWCWIIGVIGFVVLTTVLFVRGRYRTFPWFTGMLCFEILETALLFISHKSGNARAYFSVYWLGEIIEAIIRVGVVFELARITSRHLGQKRRQRARPLTYSLLVALAVCFYVIFHVHGLGDPIVSFVLKVSLCTSILSGFLAAAMFMVTFFDGIRIRIYSQAVTYGMVFYFAGKLLSQISLLIDGNDGTGWWLTAQGALKPAYILCLFSWAVIFWLKEPAQVRNDEMNRFHDLGVAIERQKEVPQGSALGLSDYRTALLDTPSELITREDHRTPIRDRQWPLLAGASAGNGRVLGFPVASAGAGGGQDHVQPGPAAHRRGRDFTDREAG